MPFGYYGSKKGSAHRYPPPAYPTIIEPFAGAAGYALTWATVGQRVILIEKDPIIAMVWKRLQSPDAREDLLSIPDPVKGQPVTDPLVALAASGHPRRPTASSRMEEQWPHMRDRIIDRLPLIQSWEVLEGDYTVAPDVIATWFIDPPYAPKPDGRDPGNLYPEGSSGIDYSALAEWCRSRRGQVIVCEQEGATWLPFRRLYRQRGLSQQGGDRIEVVWTRTPGRMLATPAARRAAPNKRRSR